MSTDGLGNKTKAALVELAKTLGVRSPAYSDKKTLIETIQKELDEPTAPKESTVSCVHGATISKCSICVEKRYCVHGRYKYSCKPCGGSRFCKHVFRGCSDCYGKIERLKESLRLKPTD